MHFYFRIKQRELIFEQWHEWASLRKVHHSGGWIKALLEEAENESIP
jgi:hypothetical protein